MTESQADVPALSVVIPFFNEQGRVAPLLDELHAVADEWPGRVEVILVDDGSTDGTSAELRAVAGRWSACRVHTMARNSGQAAALWCGLHAASAPIIATLDGDGQNDPADLLLLRGLLDSADMVTGWRVRRQDSLLRRWMSRVANAVRSRWLGDGVHDTGCALKLLRREVVESFLPVRSLYSFMPAMAVSLGFRVVEHPVRHRPRQGGESKYGLRVMLWRPLVDMLAIGWVLRRRIPRVGTRSVG
jgi:dolichol-phosphate mannosyltransferase